MNRFGQLTTFQPCSYTSESVTKLLKYSLECDVTVTGRATKHLAMSFAVSTVTGL